MSITLHFNTYYTYDFLFQCENVMIEKLVQLLISVIYAQLFERIDSEIFETEYVEDAKKSGRILSWICASINVVNEPRESSRVQRFSHCMSVFNRLKKI